METKKQKVTMHGKFYILVPRIGYVRTPSMGKKSNLYVPIKIPRTLADKMDLLIGKFCYRTRAEIAKDGIRIILREHLNCNKDQEAP